MINRLARKVILSIMALLFITVLIPPIFKIFNSIDPWVLGLPFMQFWIIFVSLACSVLLYLLCYIETPKNKEAKENE